MRCRLQNVSSTLNDVPCLCTEMKNFKLVLEYDGTSYFGWQKQENNKRFPTIQAVLEDALKKIFGRNVPVAGSGRTDTGVHAAGQTASFRMDTQIEPSCILKALNTYIPGDIRIKTIEEVPLSFNPRFDAKKKWYRYTLFCTDIPSVFCRHYAVHLPYKLDIDKMKRTAGYMTGVRDFSCIVRSPGRDKVRHIYSIDLLKKGHYIYIDVKGTGFLYKMVRRIAGILIDTGRGKITPYAVKKLLKGERSGIHIQTAPAKGLMLMQVEY